MKIAIQQESLQDMVLWLNMFDWRIYMMVVIAVVFKEMELAQFIPQHGTYGRSMHQA
jgi:hypothetical protein